YDVQRPRELVQARENIMGDFNPATGELVARTPYEAGDVVQKGVQEAARAAKAGVTAAYEEAKGRGGVIHPNVFEDIGTSLRRDLAAGENPVLIDEKLTPYADAMLKDADAFFKRIAQGESGGASLEAVDVARKRLSKLRGDAFRSRDGATDGRA